MDRETRHSRLQAPHIYARVEYDRGYHSWSAPDCGEYEQLVMQSDYPPKQDVTDADAIDGGVDNPSEVSRT